MDVNYKLAVMISNFWTIMCMTTVRSHLTSVERSIEGSIKELDNNIVKYLTEPPPNITNNVEQVANMNVLFYRSVIDYYNYLSGIGDLLIEEDENAYRLINEIGIEGPKFLEIEMIKKSWDAIAKMYDYKEGEIEEMINTIASCKLMWAHQKQQLEKYLIKKNKKELSEENKN